ncbi:MarR family winged helix-turn-helix transcriptional regulator [Saccharopolyspora sp. TS4A08]|uniref:MarR family winged helix-turn-helix transcriptional regulator n=1 Tax=Saccharopolyspora ipomoeae TaxID=3042027 RepID=A0ABT6PWD7_9PSEU|nr:MarR family winged helix-turn-helix transcriptional regulator [Saccharopolyspora sp. TS4A08]MDI2032328.1 MarR family winged helix-turn-helix transcriptional regulator [Saccharopolyspora sp. TS4A08]
MGPTPETCGELLRPLRALMGLKQVALQRGLQLSDQVPYAAAGLLTELVHRGESRVSDLAHHRIVDASVVSRQVNQLEQAELITRRPDPADRRVSLLRATADGEQVVTDLERKKQEWISEALVDWDDGKVRELARLLGDAMSDIRRHTIDDGHAPDHGHTIDQGDLSAPRMREGTR